MDLPRKKSAPRFAHRLVQFAQLDVELPTATLGQVGLLLVEQTVREGVFAGGVRGFGLLNQMLPADHAVLVITEQRLDRLRLLRHLVGAGGGRGVAQPLGALADPVQRLILVVFDLLALLDNLALLALRDLLADLRGGLCGLPDPLVGGVDGYRGRWL